MKTFEVHYLEFSTGKAKKLKMTILTINLDMARIKFEEQFGFIYQFKYAREI